MVLSAQSAGQQRLLWLQQSAAVGGAVGEVARLRDENRRLKSENHLLKSREADAACRKRYSPMQRLQILWHMAYYQIPRNRVTKHFLIAKSTLYRWLHAAEKGDLGERRSKLESPRKTPRQIAEMIWGIFEANPLFGRNRIANILWLLGVFVAASTVRNVLVRPRPRTAPAAAKAKAAPAAPREIVARYPNHVWSVDRTRVLRWGLWPTWVLVAIDHFSRAIMAAVPLEGPNAGWVVGALEEAFGQHGPPRHLISDQEGVFTSELFGGLLHEWDVKHRFGAVGKHGSIAVTERVILTLKYEWLRRVPVIRGLDHLSQLLRDFVVYYNTYRGHTTLGGALPALVHRGEQWEKPEKSAKTLPVNLERRVFADTRLTAYRLAA
jgi:transposase InsO family protein